MNFRRWPPPVLLWWCLESFCFPEHIFAFKHMSKVRGASLWQCLRFPQKLPQNVLKYFFTYFKYHPILLSYFAIHWILLVYRYGTCQNFIDLLDVVACQPLPVFAFCHANPKGGSRLSIWNVSLPQRPWALGKLLLFYPFAFACLEDQEQRLLTFFSFSMNNSSRIWDSWYTSLLHSLPVPTCLRPLFCYISIYFEQRLKMKTK